MPLFLFLTLIVVFLVFPLGYNHGVLAGTIVTLSLSSASVSANYNSFSESCYSWMQKYTDMPGFKANFFVNLRTPYF